MLCFLRNDGVVEEFADFYYCIGYVYRAGRVGLEKRADVLQHDLSGGYGVGIFLPVFLVPPGD